jgi:hypothetical protein
VGYRVYHACEWWDGDGLKGLGFRVFGVFVDGGRRFAFPPYGNGGLERFRAVGAAQKSVLSGARLRG